MVSSLIVFGRNAAGFGICSTADRVPKIPRISRVVARFGPLSASLKVREQRLPRAENPRVGDLSIRRAKRAAMQRCVPASLCPSVGSLACRRK